MGYGLISPLARQEDSSLIYHWPTYPGKSVESCWVDTVSGLAMEVVSPGFHDDNATMTPHGGTAWERTNGGNAMTFLGGSASESIIQDWEAISISLWFKFHRSSGNNNRWLVNKFWDGSNRCLNLEANSSDKVFWNISTNSSNANAGPVSTTGITTNKWYYLTVTWEAGTSNNARLYLNGRLDAQTTRSGTTVRNNNEELRFAGSYNGGNAFVSMGDIRIYRRSLTESQSRRLYLYPQRRRTLIVPLSGSGGGSSSGIAAVIAGARSSSVASFSPGLKSSTVDGTGGSANSSSDSTFSSGTNTSTASGTGGSAGSASSSTFSPSFSSTVLADISGGQATSVASFDSGLFSGTATVTAGSGVTSVAATTNQTFLSTVATVGGAGVSSSSSIYDPGTKTAAAAGISGAQTSAIGASSDVYNSSVSTLAGSQSASSSTYSLPVFSAVSPVNTSGAGTSSSGVSFTGTAGVAAAGSGARATSVAAVVGPVYDATVTSQAGSAQAASVVLFGASLGIASAETAGGAQIIAMSSFTNPDLAGLNTYFATLSVTFDKEFTVHLT